MKTSNRAVNRKNKIDIIKNKEIIIYKNGKEFKHFKISETKTLKDDELFILDYLLKKYSGYEIPTKNSIVNEYNHRSQKYQKKEEGEEEDYPPSQKNRKNLKNVEIENEEEEDFDNGENIQNEKITEIKKLKKDIKTTQQMKVPIKRNIKENYYYNEGNVSFNNNDVEEEEEDEDEPQFIIELESYTSPTYKKTDSNRAGIEIVNGIRVSQMLCGKEMKGIIYLGDNYKLIFICYEGKKETEIDLNNIKRIYYNVKGSQNLKNYKSNSNEKFIQFIDLNDKKFDFKFDNIKDLENLIKGLIHAYKKKIFCKDKNIILKRMNGVIVQSNNYSRKNKNSEIENYVKEKYGNQKYKYNYDNCGCEDDYVTTTITEVFKGGKLINEETKEESDGVIKTVNSYSPDVNEYEEFLKKSKFGQENLYLKYKRNPKNK